MADSAPEVIWRAPTKTYHRTTYPKIDPTRPELSTKGKNIVITGGGSGLGKHIARAFGNSGTTNLALISRTESTLLKTKNEIEKESPSTRVWIYVADMVDATSIEKALAAYAHDINGAVDILVANAAFLADLVPIEAADPKQWWKAYEINVKGNFNLIRAFSPVAASNAIIVDVSTAVAHLAHAVDYSSYQGSKLAGTNLFDHVQEEHPDWHVVHFHPGVIGGTEMDRTTIASGRDLPHDDRMLNISSCTHKIY